MLVSSGDQTARHHFLLTPPPPLSPKPKPAHQHSPPPHDISQEEFQSQKLYHEWCIRRKNAFTLATTQWAVVANTVMEKYEGYGDENVLWNLEDICECCLLLSWGSTTEDITIAYKEIPQYFYKGKMNLSWSPQGHVAKSIFACMCACPLILCIHEFCLLLLEHRGKATVPIFHVNNEFLIWAPHEILISGILAHRGRYKIKSGGRD